MVTTWATDAAGAALADLERLRAERDRLRTMLAGVSALDAEVREAGHAALPVADEMCWLSAARRRYDQQLLALHAAVGRVGAELSAAVEAGRLREIRLDAAVADAAARLRAATGVCGP